MEGAPPLGFIPFHQTVYGRSIVKRKTLMRVAIILFSFALVEVAIVGLFGTSLGYMLLVIILISIYLVSIKGAFAMAALPLAVNQFHPWAGENPDRLESLKNLGRVESGIAQGNIDPERDGPYDHSENTDSNNSDELEENTMHLNAFGKPDVAEEGGLPEEVDRAEIMLWTPEKGWFNPGEVPVRIARNPLSTNWVLVAGDDEGTRWGEVVGVKKGRMQWFSHLVNLAIMQAQIANGGTSYDSFADARAREESDSGLLEREWGKTTPGILSKDDLLSGGLREALRARSEMRNVDAASPSDSED
ncbi:MAG: hypothetical protein CXX80_06765 [Methanobacteriota archaeon]|nr:MAG: hypothetical protein CXX80_10530 [Euryarchaeota archaeon]PXY74565.1 MAG: hypothetical protein CXX80_06765 [Euryarchaeota archaeon]HIA90526.1 hypothetical protein [Candidatus Poseidoniales archaeon]HIB59141.1 hypothetical protein [Candidatus Poseidoniales archaeon]